MQTSHQGCRCNLGLVSSPPGELTTPRSACGIQTASAFRPVGSTPPNPNHPLPSPYTRQKFSVPSADGIPPRRRSKYTNLYPIIRIYTHLYPFIPIFFSPTHALYGVRQPELPLSDADPANGIIPPPQRRAPPGSPFLFHLFADKASTLRNAAAGTVAFESPPPKASDYPPLPGNHYSRFHQPFTHKMSTFLRKCLISHFFPNYAGQNASHPPI